MPTLAAKQDEKPPAKPETAYLQAEINALEQIAELMRRYLEDLREDSDRWRTVFENAQRLLPAPTPATPAALLGPAGERRCRWWTASQQSTART
jgi:hypothetical protein